MLEKLQLVVEAWMLSLSALLKDESDLQALRCIHMMNLISTAYEITLNVIMLKREIFPPEADIT